jgi:hypothetical protein
VRTAVQHDVGVKHRASQRAPRPPRRFKLTRELVMCVVAGVVLSVVGTVTFTEVYTLAHRSEVVTGTVIDKQSSLRRPRPTITVKFVTRSGRTVVGETWRFETEPEVGDRIPVEDDPQDPTVMQAADWGHDYWLELIFFGAAALVVALGVVNSFKREAERST